MNVKNELREKDGLKGKIAVLTASTDGIGLACAKELLKKGVTVFISSRKEDNVIKALDELKKYGGNVYGYVCNGGNLDDIKRLVDRINAILSHKTIDILISNVGTNPVPFDKRNIMEIPDSVIEKILKINIWSAIAMIREFAPYLSEGASVIINGSSSAYDSYKHNDDGLGIYAISKTALLAVTKIFANELFKRKIRVNSINPGPIDTKFSKLLQNNNMLLDNLLYGRFGKPEEIAKIVCFLASDDAKLITGENFVISGGLQSRL